MNSLFKKLSKGRYPPLPEHFSMELANIIDSMLRVNPKDRISCQNILDHPVFKSRVEKYYGLGYLNSTIVK